MGGRGSHWHISEIDEHPVDNYNMKICMYGWGPLIELYIKIFLIKYAFARFANLL